jgi:hypothetical protein
MYMPADEPQVALQSVYSTSKAASASSPLQAVLSQKSAFMERNT